MTAPLSSLGEGEECAPLRCLSLGGEAMAPRTLARWGARAPQVALRNVYGTTEGCAFQTRAVVGPQSQHPQPTTP